jgi:glucose dehydrogenase
VKSLAPTAITALLVAAIALLAAGCGGGSSTSSSASPAFSASELASLPTTNWITNGGSISNQRYSPLTQINAGNVGRRKSIWHIHLRSGTAGKYSAEGQPLVTTTSCTLPGHAAAGMKFA